MEYTNFELTKHQVKEKLMHKKGERTSNTCYKYLFFFFLKAQKHEIRGTNILGETLISHGKTS